MGRNNEEGRRRAAAVYRDARRARGLKDSDLVDITGIDKGTLSDFALAKRWPNVATRDPLEDALGLPRGTFQLAYDGAAVPSVDDGALSDPPTSVVVSAHTGEESAPSAQQSVTVRIGALDMEFSATFADADDRERALAAITQAVAKFKGGTGAGGGRDGSDS